VEEEVAMVRCLGLLAVLWAAFVVSTAAAKPPDDAPRLDDEKQEVTRTLAGGKVEKSKVELKYYLQVKGAFDEDGFTLEAVEPGGPAAMLTNEDGTGNVMLEAGDVIKEVDGKAVKSAKDYAKALNDAKDHTKIKLKIVDVRTGNELTCLASAKEREKEKKDGDKEKKDGDKDK
jgi:S1-C subfamily serine protease